MIGNMLTDSASAVKYWYFMRVGGGKGSAMQVECGLKTNSNVVMLSEKAEDCTLEQIVNNLCDVISARAVKNMNYGCILIPTFLLGELPLESKLIAELSNLFEGKSAAEVKQLKGK